MKQLPAADSEADFAWQGQDNVPAAGPGSHVIEANAHVGESEFSFQRQSNPVG